MSDFSPATLTAVVVLISDGTRRCLFGAEPMVRILFPPALSQLRTGPSRFPGGCERGPRVAAGFSCRRSGDADGLHELDPRRRKTSTSSRRPPLRWPTRRTGTIEQNTAAGTHYAWAETGPSATPRDGPRYPMPPSRDRLRWCAWCSMWRRSGQPRPPPGELCQERHRRCSPVRQNRRDAEKHARSPHPPRLRAGSSLSRNVRERVPTRTPGEAGEGAAGCRPRPGWRVGPSPAAGPSAID